MAGQIIVLQGVNTGAPSAAPRVDMTAADLIASRTAGLLHAFSPRSARSEGGELISRCRLTGAPIAQKGESGTFSIVDRDGNKSLTQTQLGPRSLEFPTNISALPCLSVVGAFNNLLSTDSSSSVINFLSLISEQNEYVGMPLRWYSNDNGVWSDLTVNSGFSTSRDVGAAFLTPVNSWAVFYIEIDPFSGKVKISINGLSGIETEQNSSMVATGPAKLNIGYPLSPSSIRDAGVGDVYLFGQSMTATDYGIERVSSLIDSLTSQYGIS